MIWKRIANFDNYYCSESGIVKNFKTGNILSVTKRDPDNNYPVVKMYDNNGKSKTVTIHRIYAGLFKNNPRNLKYLNHLNGDKNDYRLENLEWCTHSENMIHAFKTGLSKGNKLLDKVQVLTIVKCLEDGFRNKELSEYFKVHNSIISNIKLRKQYSFWLD